MRSRIAIRAASALAAVSVLAACGGGGSSGNDNGVAAKSPEAIVTAASKAIDAVKSVHIAGSLNSGGTPITLDLDLLSGKGGRGTMSQNGLSFQLIVIGQTLYINGSPAFWRSFGGAAGAQLFKGKWLKAPAGTAGVSTLADLTNLRQLFSKLLGSHGTLTKGKETKVNGQKVITITDTTKGGSLYVETTGRAYPVEFTKSGSDSGHIVFSGFDKAVSLSAPAKSIDISQLHS